MLKAYAAMCPLAINSLQLSTYNRNSHLLFRGILWPETAYYNVCHRILVRCEIINMSCHLMVITVTNLSLMFMTMSHKKMKQVLLTSLNLVKMILRYIYLTIDKFGISVINFEPNV